MRLFFFGADKPWSILQNDGFRRRNTWMLKAFYESNAFTEIYAVFKTSRYKAIKSIFTRNRSTINDVFLASFLPEFIENNFLKKINHYLYKLQLNLQGVKNVSDDSNIIWCYQIKGYTQAKTINLKGRYFFDSDHNIIDDTNLEIARRTKQQEILLKAAIKCELVISSARSMLNWFKNQGFKNALRIRNGINLERFKDLEKVRNEKITIGYLGTLSRWIDYELFENLVKNNLKYDFVIIGEEYKSYDSQILKNYSNVKFIGDKSPDGIPGLITKFDIALNLYRAEDWLDVDSMKIYEYMAADVPVVTSKFHGYLEEDFEKLLFVGETLEEIQSHIDFLVENPIEKDYAYKFLKNNSWLERAQYFIKQIEN